jgi:acylphosphatase
MENSGRRIIITGMVQGVGYRYYCSRAAQALGIRGYVMNMPDGSVEMEVFGGTAAMDKFTQEITRTDVFFEIEGIKSSVIPDENKYGDFYILHYPG